MLTATGQGPKPATLALRLFVFAMLAVSLMVLDHQGGYLEKARSGLWFVVRPLVAIAAVPANVGNAVSNFFSTRESLRAELEVLRNEQQQVQLRLQSLDALQVENRRLRALLGAAAQVADRAMVAELVLVSAEPFVRNIIVDRGTQSDVFVGQPVLDAVGVMGQVTEVNGTNSRVTLITDPGSAIPVQVVRSGLRAIVFGTGADDALDIPFLTNSADIRENDVLVTSGMGGRFPPRYPVAVVTKIVSDPNEAFLKITAKPVARLNHDKEVMLIWPGTPQASTGASK
jgi:rod shape-determining protein MreC